MTELPIELPFEEEFHQGILPTHHLPKKGKPLLILELDRFQLQRIWEWFHVRYRSDPRLSPIYMALSRERKRRALGGPMEHQSTSDDPPSPTQMVHPPLKCPECDKNMRLKPSRYGLFYGCEGYPKCTSTHGAHPDGKPLGTPANKETKVARIRAHEVFDRLWKAPEGEYRKGLMKRREAYQWLQTAMKLSKDDAHIGKFDIEKCDRLIVEVEKFLKERTK